MPEFVGILERVELGTGAWALECEGRRYALTGAIPGDLAGRKVRVRGREAASFGFAMTGDPQLAVESIEPA